MTRALIARNLIVTVHVYIAEKLKDRPSSTMFRLNSRRTAKFDFRPKDTQSLTRGGTFTVLQVKMTSWSSLPRTTTTCTSGLFLANWAVSKSSTNLWLSYEVTKTTSQPSAIIHALQRWLLPISEEQSGCGRQLMTNKFNWKAFFSHFICISWLI